MVLDFNKMQLAVEFFKLDKFTDEEVSVTVSHLRISDVDHVVIDVEVKLEQYNFQLSITPYSNATNFVGKVRAVLPL